MSPICTSTYASGSSLALSHLSSKCTRRPTESEWVHFAFGDQTQQTCIGRCGTNKHQSGSNNNAPIPTLTKSIKIGICIRAMCVGIHVGIASQALLHSSIVENTRKLDNSFQASVAMQSCPRNLRGKKITLSSTASLRPDIPNPSPPTHSPTIGQPLRMRCIGNALHAPHRQPMLYAL